MTLYVDSKPKTYKPLFFSRPEEKFDPEQLKRDLVDLTRRRCMTERDDQILKLLYDLDVLSTDQVHRIFWAKKKSVSASDRLLKLYRWHLVRVARQPSTKLSLVGLPPCHVFGLGAAGWLWLNQAEPAEYAYNLIDQEWVRHKLMVAEVYTMFLEDAVAQPIPTTLKWLGQRSGPTVPGFTPDGLALITQETERGEARAGFFVQVPGESREDWQAMVTAFDQLYLSPWQQHKALRDVPGFPPVIAIASDQKAVESAVELLQERQQPIRYYFAAWNKLFSTQQMLPKKPIWLYLDAEGKLHGRKRENRVTLAPG